MARNPDNLFVEPAFFAALEGEFSPPQDPQNRAHRLSRLAIATFEKGLYVRVEDPELVSFEYSPSWAADTYSTVFCEMDADRVGDPQAKAKLRVLVLAHDEQELELYDIFSRSDSKVSSFGLTIVRDIPDDLELVMPLSLATEPLIDGAAKEAARFAQGFFDTAAQS